MVRVSASLRWIVDLINGVMVIVSASRTLDCGFDLWCNGSCVHLSYG